MPSVRPPRAQGGWRQWEWCGRHMRMHAREPPRARLERRRRTRTSAKSKEKSAVAMERVNGGACGGRGGPKDVLSASHAHGIDGDHGQAAWKYRRPSTRQSGRTTAHATESRTARAPVPHSCATARCSEQARREASVRDAIMRASGVRGWQKSQRSGPGRQHVERVAAVPARQSRLCAQWTRRSPVPPRHARRRSPAAISVVGGAAGRGPHQFMVRYIEGGAARPRLVDLG